jgi:radical SAM protein with 4Fe4S-binding SPASM domain
MPTVGEGLGWGMKVRFLHGRDQTVIVDLERGNFIKIGIEAFRAVQKALTNGIEAVLQGLDNQNRTDFKNLLKTLQQKDFLFRTDRVLQHTAANAEQPAFLDVPKIVYYAVSDLCNLACSFCYADSKRAEPYKGNTARSLKIVDRLIGINVANLILSGGEPLLREDFFDIVEYAKDKDLFVGVTTNGTLLGPHEATRMRDSAIDYVQISIESYDEAEHDSLRGKGTYRKCIDAIKLLKERGFQQNQLYVTATTTRKNISALNRYAAFAEDLGVTPGLSFFQPVGRGHLNRNSLACTEREMLGFVLSKMKTKRASLTASCPDANVLAKLIDSSLVPHIINCCGMGYRTLGIKENGQVVPCHLFFCGTEYGMGNILDDDIVDRLDAFIGTMPTVDDIEECRDCNVRYFCANGCWANVYWTYGHLDKKNPFCEFYKKYFSAVIWNLGLDDSMTKIYNEIELLSRENQKT